MKISEIIDYEDVILYMRKYDRDFLIGILLGYMTDNSDIKLHDEVKMSVFHQLLKIDLTFLEVSHG